jgi:hypothetical protein
MKSDMSEDLMTRLIGERYVLLVKKAPKTWRGGRSSGHEIPGGISS